MSRGRVAGALLNAARIGQAQAFFGNVYEAVVRVPHVFAENRVLAGSSPFRKGSPTTYFVPAGPLTLAASVGALAVGGHDRRWLAAGATATTAAAGLTAYVVTRVNVPLLLDEREPTPDEKAALLRKWYRLNALRIALVGSAWYATERARGLSSRR
jgi:hypothetical protein